MQIGSHSLRNGLIAAPMAGVSDRAFRKLCRRFGAGLAVSEMVGAAVNLSATGKSRRRLDHSGETGPISVQIAGAEPAMMAEAARRNVDLGAGIIDINMGCPAKKVCNRAAGSALLRDELLVGAILEAVVAAVEVPVTLKFRTGWDHSTRNAVRVAAIAESAGIRMLVLHGRTRACGFAGAAEFDSVAEVKSRAGVPVIANGDIDSPERAREVLCATGADGVMIGRAAQGRPWLFGEIEAYLATGVRPAPPPPALVRAVVLEHLGELHSLYGREAGVGIARKHIAWYARGRPGADAFRQAFNQLETCEAQHAAAAGFFGELPEAAHPPRDGEIVFA